LKHEKQQLSNKSLHQWNKMHFSIQAMQLRDEKQQQKKTEKKNPPDLRI
jgi:hypothetical protein